MRIRHPFLGLSPSAGLRASCVPRRTRGPSCASCAANHAHEGWRRGQGKGGRLGRSGGRRWGAEGQQGKSGRRVREEATQAEHQTLQFTQRTYVKRPLLAQTSCYRCFWGVLGCYPAAAPGIPAHPEPICKTASVGTAILLQCFRGALAEQHGKSPGGIPPNA